MSIDRRIAQLLIGYHDLSWNLFIHLIHVRIAGGSGDRRRWFRSRRCPRRSLGKPLALWSDRQNRALNRSRSTTHGCYMKGATTHGYKDATWRIHGLGNRSSERTALCDVKSAFTSFVLIYFACKAINRAKRALRVQTGIHMVVLYRQLLGSYFPHPVHWL